MSHLTSSQIAYLRRFSFNSLITSMNREINSVFNCYFFKKFHSQIRKFTAVTEQINCGESFEFYNCTTRKDAFLKIQIPGHFWSNEAVISEKTVEKLLIKDINGNQSEISVQQKASISADSQSGCR